MTVLKMQDVEDIGPEMRRQIPFHSECSNNSSCLSFSSLVNMSMSCQYLKGRIREDHVRMLQSENLGLPETRGVTKSTDALWHAANDSGSKQCSHSCLRAMTLLQEHVKLLMQLLTRCTTLTDTRLTMRKRTIANNSISSLQGVSGHRPGTRTQCHQRPSTHILQNQ